MRVAKGRNPFLAWSGLLLVLTFAAPRVARADEPKVEVKAEVVLASNQGSAIDPPELAKMKDQFMKSGLAFTSFKRLQSQRLSLQQGKPAKMDLPNNKPATFNLESVKDGTARVQVQVPKLNTTVVLGREGEVFMQAGNHEGGKLVLVLSAANAAPAKPRRARSQRSAMQSLPRAEQSVQPEQ